VVKINSKSQENQMSQAMSALAQFVKLLVLEYPMAFNGESGTLKIVPTKHHCPYEVSLIIKKKNFYRKSSKVTNAKRNSTKKVASLKKQRSTESV
jgi:hypothetical protein